MSQWWRVTPSPATGGAAFLVLVVSDRVAVLAGLGPAPIEPGEVWRTARQWLEASGFSCVMVST